jgi:hypothetical protein
VLPLIKKLFSSKPNPHVAALAKAIAQNKIDYEFAASFRCEGAEKELQAKLGELKRDPENRELANECIAIGARLSAEREARAGICAIVGPHIAFKVEHRTRETVKPALQIIVDKLTEELATVTKKDLAEAENYGIPTKPGPVAQELASALETAKNFLGQVDAATVGTLPALVEFAMAESK